MRRDQHRLTTRLRNLQQQHEGQHSPAAAAAADDALRRLAEEVDRSADVRARRLANLPKPTFPEELPVVQRRDEIGRTIAENQVIVLSGETGLAASPGLGRRGRCERPR